MDGGAEGVGVGGTDPCLVVGEGGDEYVENRVGEGVKFSGDVGQQCGEAMTRCDADSGEWVGQGFGQNGQDVVEVIFDRISCRKTYRLFSFKIIKIVQTCCCNEHAKLQKYACKNMR